MNSFFSRRLVVVGATIVLAGFLAAAVAAYLSTPTPVGLQALVSERVRAAGGTPVAVTRISPLLGEAVVATEDERFYGNRGIDVLGLLRAVPYDLSHLSFAQGASTITEQVAKLLYLGGNDHNAWRKLEDAALAVKLESRYDKEQILDAYLNSVYFGSGATGAAAASERFFGIPAGRLDLAQASLLAGLIQAPSAYDPLRAPRAARLRQIDVLRSLVRDGYATEEQAADVAATPLPIRGARPIAPVRGVDFAPGPAFVWRELALGAAVTTAALLGFVALRRRTLSIPLLRLATQTALGLVLILGAAAIVRSFRVI